MEGQSWGSVNVGSNVFQDTPGVLVVQGEPQIFVERAGTGDQLLLGMDIYDIVDGKVQHVAKLRRNAWVFNNKDRYELTTNPAALTLTERATNRLVVRVDASRAAVGELAIPEACFYTKSGLLVQVEPSALHVGGSTLSSCVIANCTAGIGIG